MAHSDRADRRARAIRDPAMSRDHRVDQAARSLQVGRVVRAERAAMGRADPGDLEGLVGRGWVEVRAGRAGQVGRVVALVPGCRVLLEITILYCIIFNIYVLFSPGGPDSPGGPGVPGGPGGPGGQAGHGGGADVWHGAL